MTQMVMGDNYVYIQDRIMVNIH